MEGSSVLEQAAELARRGETFALATVVWRQGPSSGKPGCRAIITTTGEVRGWIGGACAEPAVIRAARQVLADGEPKLLLLGTPAQFGGAVPDGMTVVPISCASDGALEVYIEAVQPVPHLVVVGASPMARTLVDLAADLGWRSTLVDGAAFTAADASARSMVVVATQGHHDEDALEQALAAAPAYVSLVGSRRRGAAVLGYLADRGVPREQLDRVRVPAGLDLGRLAHREIAVAVLAELVRLRAAGELHVATTLPAEPELVVDPVCGMTVTPGPAAYPLERAGATYFFCCAGCRHSFESDPAAYLKAADVADADVREGTRC